MTENFPKLISDTKPQIQRDQRIPGRINAERITPKHILLKLQKIKDKEKILKDARGKHFNYREAKIRITFNFSSETTKQEESGVK